MGRRRTFSRRAATRNPGKKFIVICEGKKTEKGYFEGIRISLRLPKSRIIVKHPNGTDPLTIVNAAIEERSDQHSNRAWNEKDEVWAVFDGDEHINSNFDNWNAAIQKARDNEIKLAISNPCFELWYILHYQDHQAGITRQEALRILLRHVRDYAKSNILYPNPLKELTEDAIQRAAKLKKYTKGEGLGKHCNPSTGVTKLVKKLLKLDKD